MIRGRVASLVAAVWTLYAFAVSRVRTRRRGVSARGPKCWPLPQSARPTVWWTLDRVHPTCLERSLVLQQWDRGQGRIADVLVGVPKEGVGERDIHAWVEGDPHVDVDTYAVIHRLS